MSELSILELLRDAETRLAEVSVGPHDVIVFAQPDAKSARRRGGNRSYMWPPEQFDHDLLRPMGIEAQNFNWKPGGWLYSNRTVLLTCEGSAWENFAEIGSELLHAIDGRPRNQRFVISDSWRDLDRVLPTPHETDACYPDRYPRVTLPSICYNGPWAEFLLKMLLSRTYGMPAVERWVEEADGLKPCKSSGKRWQFTSPRLTAEVCRAAIKSLIHPLEPSPPLGAEAARGAPTPDLINPPNLPPRVMEARDQYETACEALGNDSPTDAEAYGVLLKAYKADNGISPLPKFATWTSYLRKWRAATGQQKRKRRNAKNDVAGGSVVLADQLDGLDRPGVHGSERKSERS